MSEGSIITPKSSLKVSQLRATKRHCPLGSPPSSPILIPKRVRPRAQQYLNDSTDGESDMGEDPTGNTPGKDHTVTNNSTPGEDHTLNTVSDHKPEDMGTSTELVFQENHCVPVIMKRGRPRVHKKRDMTSAEVIGASQSSSVEMSQCKRMVGQGTEEEGLKELDTEEIVMEGEEKVFVVDSSEVTSKAEPCLGHRIEDTKQSHGEDATKCPTPRRLRRKHGEVSREPYRLRQGAKQAAGGVGEAPDVVLQATNTAEMVTCSSG